MEIYFLNRTLDLRKSFLNQTTYVLKFWLLQQSFLNRDSILNCSFLSQDLSVLTHIFHFFLQLPLQDSHRIRITLPFPVKIYDIARKNGQIAKFLLA